jgi:hypothetical protein
MFTPCPTERSKATADRPTEVPKWSLAKMIKRKTLNREASHG